MVNVLNVSKYFNRGHRLISTVCVGAKLYILAFDPKNNKNGYVRLSPRKLKQCPRY